MKRIRLSLAAFSVYFLVACAEKKAPEPTPVPSAAPVEQAEMPDEIVSDSVSNDQKQVLKMRFNNTKGLGTFTLNGESFELKQDTTASGIRYSNETYVFTEWQGDIKLTKNGKTVFSQHK